MYTILMNENKILVKTKTTTLYQREKLIDEIQFLLPQTYGDFDLSEFTVALKYIDQSNVSHLEILTLSDDLYKDKLRYSLPVDTNLTKFAGDIKIRLTLTKTDLETKKQYVLHSSENIITITPLQDYYSFVTDESLEFTDRIIGEFEATKQIIQDFVSNYEADILDGEIDGIVNLNNIEFESEEI